MSQFNRVDINFL